MDWGRARTNRRDSLAKLGLSGVRAAKCRRPGVNTNRWAPGGRAISERVNAVVLITHSLGMRDRAARQPTPHRRLRVWVRCAVTAHGDALLYRICDRRLPGKMLHAIDRSPTFRFVCERSIEV